MNGKKVVEKKIIYFLIEICRFLIKGRLIRLSSDINTVFYK